MPALVSFPFCHLCRSAMARGLHRCFSRLHERLHFSLKRPALCTCSQSAASRGTTRPRKQTGGKKSVMVSGRLDHLIDIASTPDLRASHLSSSSSLSFVPSPPASHTHTLSPRPPQPPSPCLELTLLVHDQQPIYPLPPAILRVG